MKSGRNRERTRGRDTGELDAGGGETLLGLRETDAVGSANTLSARINT